jgi:hypothetical protein
LATVPRADGDGEQEIETCGKSEPGETRKLRKLSSEEYGRVPKVGPDGMRAD